MPYSYCYWCTNIVIRIVEADGGVHEVDLVHTKLTFVASKVQVADWESEPAAFFALASTAAASELDATAHGFSDII